MKGMNRRRFLQVTGAGSIAVAAGTAAAVPTLSTTPRLATDSTRGTFTFRAVTGLPSKPLPAYASYVLEGHVNLTTRSGVVTKTAFAGPPEARSLTALPGLSRIFRITDVQDVGGTLRVIGVIDDRSQLQRGESSTLELLIDTEKQLARTSFFGTDIVLQLEK